MIYLLDTNMVSEIMRNRTGSVARRVDEVGLENVAVSVIVAGEIEFGLALKQSRRLQVAAEALLKGLTVLDIGMDAARHYGRIRADSKRAGKPVGPNDLWIAAHALALDAVLVTDNEKEFSRIAGLKVENWLRHAA